MPSAALRAAPTWAAATALILPIAAVVAAVLVPSSGTLPRLWQTVLPGYLVNTAVIATAVPFLAAVVGTGLAWLTTRYEFPGRRILTVLAAAPLAVPSYIAAYAYAGLLGYTGPLQLGLRRLGAPQPEHLYLLPIASVPGLVLVLVFVLFPYVYLTARAAFCGRTERLFEAARSLGTGRGLFRRVALPVARPAVAAGMLLVLMESLAAYGAPFYLGVDTLTTGVFRRWFAAGDLVAALKLASVLLLVALLAVAGEQLTRGGARYAAGGATSGLGGARRRLCGPRGAAAAAVGAAPVILGFVLPVAMLLWWFATAGAPPTGTLRAAWGTVVAAGTAAAVAVLLSTWFAWTTRTAGGAGPATRGVVAAAVSAYAVPGAVIAVGVLAVVAGADRLLGPIAGHLGSLPFRGAVSGSFAALIYAYLVRYLAVGYRPVAAGFAAVGVAPERASRSLGHGPAATLGRVHVPLGRSSLAAAFVLVFVDVSKELPLTLVVRPFDFETLAVRAFALAADERLGQAAGPSLLLVLIGVAGMTIAGRLLGGRERQGRARDW
jgi:iron(III) transport system permease protein